MLLFDASALCFVTVVLLTTKVGIKFLVEKPKNAREQLFKFLASGSNICTNSLVKILFWVNGANRRREKSGTMCQHDDRSIE